VNSSGNDVCPTISTDGLTLVFNRGLHSLWATTRKSTEDDWGAAVMLGIDGPGYFYGPALSSDGSTMYFQASHKWGGFGVDDIWQVTFTPIVDFNGDGIVDSIDMCVMVDHWGEDYPLCDIGPMPWGDGIVDVQDLIVLAEHLFEDYRLVAHWKLDETEGDIAHEIVGEYYGTLQGGPLWQPTEGKIDGALQFDGIDDCVISGSPLNPADGDFSVFVWVKCDTPGQVILSQIDAANWLCTDLVGGCLMTQLQAAGRGGAPLLSNTCITDNNWHEIGFVWDGSYRYLYVDGVEVANDDAPLPGLISAESGLFFGTGCHRESFFSGLIDDVRIYNVALAPEQIAALAQ
jgi:hypothetical protein